MILTEVVPTFESEIGNVKATMPKRPFLMYARSLYRPETWNFEDKAQMQEDCAVILQR